jgi:nucleoside-diphosphate-sugar epimerase
MIAAARDADVGRFVQESFAPIYEDAGDGWIAEDARLRPVRYNRTILDAERALHQFTEAGGVGIVLRFASFYGPDSKQLGQMVSFVRRGWGPLPGPPESFVSCVSHDDAATAVATALSLPAGVYNVADDEPLRHRDFVDALAHAVGAAPPRLFPAWVTQIGGSLARMYARSLRISNMKLRQQGWSPRYPSARDGLPVAIAALA